MVTIKQQVLDIAMNLTRIGNWAADRFDAKQKRIEFFLNQTNDYIKSIHTATLPSRFAPTMHAFLPIFESLRNDGQTKPADTEAWAESMMTWGTILTHRASLL